MSIVQKIENFKNEIPETVTLVAISKTKPENDILEAYNAGQRIFGENKIQELEEKRANLPADIEWHMVGHVQRNKVKYMAEFVELVHAVDSLKLLKEIEKQAAKYERTIKCLLQIKIADEDSKYGINIDKARSILESDEFQKMKHVQVVGLMGMATFTDDEEKIKGEFNFLKKTYDQLASQHSSFTTLSMGMSGDYKIAIDCGSNMIRIGSSIFGERNYN